MVGCGSEISGGYYGLRIADIADGGWRRVNSGRYMVDGGIRQ